MKKILEKIKIAAKQNKKLLAVLIDPDKMKLGSLSQFIDKINQSKVTHIFVGGSTVKPEVTQTLVSTLKPLTSLPIVLFPGDVSQISNNADALLFLSLLSGRNPDYLIGKHVEAVPILRGSALEIIPTGYVLVEGGRETAVQKVTHTTPLNNKQEIINTAKAGELLGLQLVYLEAGSGATNAIEPKLINAVKQHLTIPLIVGGGVRSKSQIIQAYDAGADLVVIGTAFEENESFFEELKHDFGIYTG